MSAAATAYVIKFSPYKGVGYALHLMVADVVNDANDNRFWMSPTELAKKARTTRVSASNWLWQEAVRDGLLEVVVDNRSVRSPGTGYAPASEFRFLEPALPVAYEPQWKAKQGTPRTRPKDADAEAGRVKPVDAARVSSDDAALEPRQATVRGPVNLDDAADRELAGQSVEPRKESLRVTQHLTKPSEPNENADAANGAAVDEGTPTATEESDPAGAPRLFAVPAAEATATAIVAAALRDAGPGIKWPTPKWRKGDDEDPNRVHTRQVQQVRQALRGWALGRLLDGDDPEAVTGWATELCRRTPATRWSAERLHEDWERMTGRAVNRGGVGSPTITPDQARRLPFGTLAGKLQSKHLAAEDRELLHEEVRLRVEATFGADNGAPALDERNGRLFLDMRWKVEETASEMHALSNELRARAGDQDDPAAAAGEAALRAIAGGAMQPSARALVEGRTQ